MSREEVGIEKREGRKAGRGAARCLAEAGGIWGHFLAAARDFASWARNFSKFLEMSRSVFGGDFHEKPRYLWEWRENERQRAASLGDF